MTEQATKPQSTLDEGRRALAFDIEDDLWRAKALTELANWIGKAQSFINGVRQVASYDEAMKQALKKHQDVLCSPDWDHHHHGVGLEALHLTVSEHLGAIRREAGLDEAARGDAPAAAKLEGKSNAH